MALKKIRSKSKTEVMREGFWGSLSTASTTLFYTAVFFTFASIGFISDLFSGGDSAPQGLIFSVFFSGFIAVAYSYTGARNIKYMPVVVVIHLLITFYWPDYPAMTFGADELLSQRLLLDGFGILFCIVTGYVLFIILISREGIKQFRLHTEISLARDIHQVLVPEIKTRYPGFEVFGNSVTTSEVGGDLFDLMALKKGLFAYTADVSGHGVQAGVLMGMFKSALHALLQREIALPEMANDLNRSIRPLKKKNMFITFACINLDRNGKYEFTTAGHLPVLHIHVTERRAERLLLKQIPVGVDDNYQFETGEARYKKGDILALITDGLTESMDHSGEEFGLERIEEILLGAGDRSLEEIGNDIFNRTAEFGSQHDDRSLLLIRCV